MKLLISGANGLLGSALKTLASARGHECKSLDRMYVSFSLNTSFPTKLDNFFQDIDYFVHAAANTDVESCEIDPHTCHRDNFLLTELLAATARRHDVPMSFISSTGVYGSHKDTPWAEYDEAQPSTQHHISKRRGELAVMAANYSNLVIRTGWLFGGHANAKKNFVAKRIQEAILTKETYVYANQEQRGCPTSIYDLAEQILNLISLQAKGVFNVVNTGSASRYEYVTQIIRGIGLDTEVRPIAANNFKRIAPVSNNEMATNWRADTLGLPLMRSWKEALTEYLATSEIKALIK